MKDIMKKKKIFISNAMIIVLVVHKNHKGINNIVLNAEIMYHITSEKIPMMNILIALIKNVI